MNGKVSIDRAGRVVIPKSARDALGIRPGDSLDLTVDPDALTLRPSTNAGRVRRERGVWVIRTGARTTLEEANAAVAQIRSGRSQIAK